MASEKFPDSIKVQGADYVLNFVKTVIDATGPRLPGSEEERAGAAIIAGEMEKITGEKPSVEEFKVAPLASVASVPVLGMISLAAAILYYLSPIISLILCVVDLLYAVLQVFTYTGIFDKFWRQHLSQNVYSALLPEDQKYDYTILFSGHIDSSWLWKHSLKNPGTMLLKTLSGVVGVIFLAAVSIAQIAFGNLAIWGADFGVFSIILYALPVFTFVSSFYLINFMTWDKKVASPGAMDNLTGVGCALFLEKYFKEHPEALPKNCRLVFAGIGSEEAGLKGSFAFVKAHKNDGFLNNLYHINIDSVRDFGHFNVVKGDSWLGSRFDDDLIKMSADAMKTAGHAPSIIFNPIGGCDSTPFCRAGVKTVTLNAQNPVVTDYYHTSKDTYGNLDRKSLEDFTAALFDLTDRVVRFEENRKNKNFAPKAAKN